MNHLKKTCTYFLLLTVILISVVACQKDLLSINLEQPHIKTVEFKETPSTYNQSSEDIIIIQVAADIDFDY